VTGAVLGSAGGTAITMFVLMGLAGLFTIVVPVLAGSGAWDLSPTFRPETRTRSPWIIPRDITKPAGTIARCAPAVIHHGEVRARHLDRHRSPDTGDLSFTTRDDRRYVPHGGSAAV
jgi:hypothetical protein